MLTEIEYTPTDPAELAACLQRYHAAIRIMAAYLRDSYLRLVEIETARQDTACPYSQNITQTDPVNNLEPGGVYGPTADQSQAGIFDHQPGDVAPGRPGHPGS